MGHSGGTTVMLGCAAVFTALALLLTAVAFATEHWVEVIVDRNALVGKVSEDQLSTNPLYFTRYRGLFRTCYPDNEAVWIDNHPLRTDGQCLGEPGYELERRPETSKWGDDYEIRIHLMRAHFAMFVVAMVLFIIGCVVGALGCWRISGNLLRWAGFIVFFGAFCTAVGMAFFHGYEYLEKIKLDVDEQFPAKWQVAGEYVELNRSASLMYGYSYILGWLGMAVGAIAAILYLCAAYTFGQVRHHKKRPIENAYPAPPQAPRSRAYEYAEQQPPPLPQSAVYSADYPTSAYSGYPPSMPYGGGSVAYGQPAAYPGYGY